MRTLFLFSIILLLNCLPAWAADVRDFGAKGDGRHIDSPAINAAISQVAREGGGTVVLPAGTYLSYSIRLQSNITLRLEKGAVLKAAPVTDSEGYDAAAAEGVWCGRGGGVVSRCKDNGGRGEGD